MSSNSWSERFYQSLSNRQQNSSPSLRQQQQQQLFQILLSSQIRQRWQLLQRILHSEPLYGFEAPLPTKSRVLIAWPCQRGRLTPSGARVALLANFVQLINRAFGNHVEDLVASVAPPRDNVDKDEDKRNSLILTGDIERLGLRHCRLESEEFYAKESHRLARVLSSLGLAGGEAWSNSRLGDLLAALARAERTSYHRLHWVAGHDSADRIEALAAGLSRLGYRRLAEPSPWPLHVSVGPVSLATGSPSRLEEWLLCGEAESTDWEARDNVLLQLLAPPRAMPATIGVTHWRHTGDALTAARLRRTRQRLLVESSPFKAGDTDFDEDPSSWTRQDSALAQHLADFPQAAMATYLSYEPRPLLNHLAKLSQLVDEADMVDDLTRPSSLLAKAAGRVFDSTCSVLGLLSGC